MPRRASSKGPQKRQETRERILEAAVKVLSDEGVVGVSTRRVAEEAGANQALIHYYFDSIDNLMLEVVKRIAEEVVERREARYNNGASFIENWRADKKAIVADDPLEGRTKVWFEAMAVVLNTPELTEDHLVQRMRGREVIKAALRRELEEARPGEQVNQRAEALTALVSSVRSGLSIDRLLGSESRSGTADMLDVVENLLRIELRQELSKPAVAQGVRRGRATASEQRQGAVRARAASKRRSS